MTDENDEPRAECAECHGPQFAPDENGACRACGRKPKLFEWEEVRPGTIVDVDADWPFWRACLPNEAAQRKAVPVCTGVLDYFPDALAEVARVSKTGNDQHNPGEPLHWAKEKSTDEADALVRHLLERGTRDTDGMRHSAKVAWRALALLQREIDAERNP